MKRNGHPTGDLNDAIREAGPIWSPQPGPQTAFIHCTFAEEIFYGGARGGGKTDSAIGKFLIKALQFGKGVKGVFFRRYLPNLEEVIYRSKELYGPFAEYKETTKTFNFHSGAIIKFRHLEADRDAELYQGQSLTDICFEEAGSFPSITPILKLKACLRSAKGIPCQMILTGNPGGPGALWIRTRYIDPCPEGWRPITERDDRTGTESTRIYIPSRVTDNQILMNNDPGYISRLAQVGSDQLVKAWLEGDFYVVDGAFFDNFDHKKHVLLPCELPHWWTRFRACDWGSAKPFCVLWMAHATEDFAHPSGTVVPKGAIIVYREWYGVKTKNDGTILANVGLKLYAEAVAQGILERDGRDRIDYSVLDPSAFAQDGGASIAERMFMATQGKVAFRRADNKRVGERGALSGWDQVRSRLSGEDGKPMLYFFSNCHNLLRTLPAMQHDADRAEDLDTSAEDHAVDSLRYGLMSRPYSKPAPPEKARMTSIADVNLDQLWYDREQSNSQAIQRI